VEVVMDDYGTGYSSLDVLSRLPFSAIKLDQGVVGRMSSDARNTHIVQSILYMARELSLKTVAEGVENECVYTFLMASGCNEVQGYWVSRPIPLKDFIEMLKANPRWPSSSFGLLYNAWVNHNSYRRKVLDAVYTLTKVAPEGWKDLPKMDLAHSPARCRLGQWYKKKGRRNDDASTSSHPTNPQDPHDRMHAAGEALERAVRGQAGPKSVRAALKTFLDFSDIVDAEVSRIVEEGLSETLGESYSDSSK
ncbi:MAG TPA: EAL domain-containing protein, partial [Rhodospirillales bacterium]|nr:EAL domain-containing protein [Rhodospirillales bacterium]